MCLLVIPLCFILINSYYIVERKREEKNVSLYRAGYTRAYTYAYIIMCTYLITVRAFSL